jgi:hypothetical protein
MVVTDRKLKEIKDPIQQDERMEGNLIGHFGQIEHVRLDGQRAIVFVFENRGRPNWETETFPQCDLAKLFQVFILLMKVTRMPRRQGSRF